MFPFIRLLLFISLCVVMYMCTGRTDFIEIYDDDLLLERYQIDKDSLRNGLTQKFYPSGNLFEQSEYVHGALTGERILYYENGIPEIIERYCEGMICDTIRTYYQDGTLKFEAVYTNSVMTGIARSFYPSGKLKEEVTFKENVEEGPFTEFHENGGIKWEGTYLNGPNEFGLLMEYDTTETLIRKMMCDSMAICQTIWTPEKGDMETKKIFE